MKSADKILDHLKRNRLESYTPKQIKEGLKMPDRTVKLALKKLVEDGTAFNWKGHYSYEFKVVSIHPILLNKGLHRFDMLAGEKTFSVAGELRSIRNSREKNNDAEWYLPNIEALASCVKDVSMADMQHIPEIQIYEETN